MEEDAKRHEIQQFSKSLISGDERDKRVKDILNRLAHARGELHLCITMIYIGLTGNLESGFRVARGQLQRINDTVQKLYGHQVLLAKLLEPRWQNLTQDGETEQFLLEPEDVLVLGLADEDSADGTYISESNILDWHNNTTAEDAAILVGNSGYQAEEQKSLGFVRANTRNNTFGNGLRLQVGHTKGGLDFFRRN